MVNNYNYLTLYGAINVSQMSESTIKRAYRSRRLRVLMHPKGPLFKDEWIADFLDSLTTRPLMRFSKTTG